MTSAPGAPGRHTADCPVMAEDRLDVLLNRSAERRALVQAEIDRLNAEAPVSALDARRKRIEDLRFEGADPGLDDLVGSRRVVAQRECEWVSCHSTATIWVSNRRIAATLVCEEHVGDIVCVLINRGSDMVEVRPTLAHG